jgi:hypothetical protein
MYNPIEFPQMTKSHQNFFFSINSIDIYISSNKFV